MTVLLTPGGRGLGAAPDTPDPRDLYAAEPAVVPYQFLDYERDPHMPEVWNQGQLGSCTAHGTLAALTWRLAELGVPVPMLSRLYLYWQSRAIEGTTSQDAGAQVRDAVKAAALGIPAEALWPYDITQYATTPSAEAQASANDRALTYHRVGRSVRGIQTQLTRRHLIVVGLLLYASFEADEAMSTGLVPVPDPNRESELGGHCMAVVGIGTGADWHAAGQYPNAELDASTVYVKLRNSWGPDVYQRGYLLAPAAYVTDHRLGWDYWTIRNAS